MFDSFRLGSFLALITPLNTQIEVYKASKLPQFLNKSCLNFQCNLNSKTFHTLLWLSNHFIFFFISFHILTYFSIVLLILSLDSYVVGYLFLWFSHHIHFNFHASVIFFLFKEPSIFQGEPLVLANENATILCNSPSSINGLLPIFD